MLVGVLLAGVISEVVLRATDTVPFEQSALRGYHVPDAELGWVGAPDHAARFAAPEFEILIESDARGYRRPAAHPPAPDGARRVAVFGDSFTWGWGVERGELFCDRLRELRPELAILNRGVNAYGTAQQRLLLERVLARDAPDAVLVTYFANDPQESVDDWSGRRPVFALEDGALVPHNQPVRESITGPFRELCKRSLVLTTLRSAWNELSRGLRDAGETDWLDRSVHAAEPVGWDVSAALLLDMRERCRAAGAAFGVVFVPVAFEVTRDDPAALPLRRDLLELCAEHGLPLLDLTPALREAWSASPDATREGLPYYYPHDQHWTRAGHALAAERLSEWLDDLEGP